MGDRIRIIKVDVDKYGVTASQYRIQSVPTLMLFRNGEVLWRTSGVIDKAELLATLDPLPVRISKIERAAAIEADFQRVPFSTFISADNYYQGFLHTKNDALLKDLATLLYPMPSTKLSNCSSSSASCSLPVKQWNTPPGRSFL